MALRKEKTTSPSVLSWDLKVYRSFYLNQFQCSHQIDETEAKYH